jgi:hypothetical protein
LPRGGCAPREAPEEPGNVEQLPSGALRVRIYAGIDPVTRKRHVPSQVVPAGPNAAAEAEKARARLLNQVDERRHPRTAATVGQLLERHLGELRVARKTLHMYQGVRRQARHAYLGRLKVGQVDADSLDSLYAELLLCRYHCDGKLGTGVLQHAKHCLGQRSQGRMDLPTVTRWPARQGQVP